MLLILQFEEICVRSISLHSLCTMFFVHNPLDLLLLDMFAASSGLPPS